MNKLLVLFSLAASMLAPAIAVAGPGGTTCATAESIFTNSAYSGDTSAPGYGNPVGGMGPLPSPANDAIYTYVADGASGNVIMTAAGYNYGIFLTTNCAGTTAPPLQAATGPAVGSGFPIDGLTDGVQYWIIVSANPSDASGPAGTFTFLMPFPVELQSFTIE